MEANTHFGRRMPLVTRNRYLNGLSAFLNMGKCKNWGSLNFLLKISN